MRTRDADTELTPPVGRVQHDLGSHRGGASDSDANPLYDIGVTITGPTAESAADEQLGLRVFRVHTVGHLHGGAQRRRRRRSPGPRESVADRRCLGRAGQLGAVRLRPRVDDPGDVRRRVTAVWFPPPADHDRQHDPPAHRHDDVYRHRDHPFVSRTCSRRTTATRCGPASVPTPTPKEPTSSGAAFYPVRHATLRCGRSRADDERHVSLTPLQLQVTDQTGVPAGRSVTLVHAPDSVCASGETHTVGTTDARATSR